MENLIGTPDNHDPGGKVIRVLPPGTHSRAVFSNDGYHRTELWRSWDPSVDFKLNYMLAIGMNPSTATIDHDCPTVSKLHHYARSLTGISSFLMMNVASYRATYPVDLLFPKSPDGVCSPENLDRIEEYARDAQKVIVCWGNMHPQFRPLIRAVEGRLRRAGRPVWCWGVTKSGWPRHPLYVPLYQAPLVPYVLSTTRP
jgi:hypothetical protein